jgi:glycerol-3-phosphate dehydrogenase
VTAGRPGEASEAADVVVIGAGVVGAAIARELARYQLTVVLAEAANDVGTGTTKANTAILHTGFDAVPGSLESRLLRRGSALLADYARRAGIPVERTGALLVAWTAEQESALPSIVERAVQNGYDAVRRIPVAELYQREPQLGPGALAALEIPDESIICPWTTPLAYATEAVRAGVRLMLGTRVTGAQAGPDAHVLATTSGTLRARWVVNAAGLYSDRVDAMLGGDGGFTISPRRGELIVFDKLARPLIGSILLPVPTAKSKGVLVAPTVYGNVLLGPTAQDIDDRGDTSTTAEGLASLTEAGRRIMPRLLDEEVTATYAGLRAATEHRDYQIRVDAGRRYACAAGIRSTGLSASLGIAEYLAEAMESAGLPLRPRNGSVAPPVMPYIGQAGTRPYQDAEMIAADPEYGRIVCHCERVTRGEIRDALASTVPAADLDGLRRRTRAQNGRCQGFYCAATVSELLAEGPAGDRTPADSGQPEAAGQPA